MVPRLCLASLALAGLTYVLALHAQDVAKSDLPDAKKVKEGLTQDEKQLAAKYQEFEQQLLRVKQRLERSTKQEDRDRAAVLDKVLEYSKERSVSVKFEEMLDLLKSKDLKTTTDIKDALKRTTDIADELRTIVAMLREDSRSRATQEKIRKLQDIIKDIEKVIAEQKAVEGLTQNNKTDKGELKNMQGKVTQKTGDVVKKIDDLDGKKNTKGDPKAAGKNGDKAAKSKGDGEQVAKNDDNAKSKGDGDSQEPKSGAKSGDGSENDKKGDSPAQAKSGDGPKSDPKSGDKGPDSAQAKSGGDKSGQGEPKAGDKSQNPAQAKAGGEKSGQGDPKSGAGKAKSGQGSPSSQAKSGKPGEGQGSPSQAKSGSPSQGQGGKGSKAQAKSGPSSQGQSQAKNDGSQSSPSQGQQQASNKQSNQNQNQAQSPPTGKKQVQDAEQKQQQAEDNIDKQKNDEAAQKQDDAVKDLEKAKKDLEALLRQLREEEIERLLANLQARCEKMLAMQQAVLAGTERVSKLIDANADKLANRDNKQDSLKLSDNEGDIVAEASKAIEILEADGSAIAFPEVFQQVREDMKHVQRRLGVTDVGQVTQVIENEIIDTLKEMIEALKKKRQDNQNSKPSQGQPPPNQDQKLLDKIAELKMIRSMQIRINGRTQTYGKMYQGEEAREPAIRRELNGLGERQERLFEITNRMAKGDNR
jgi:hypothetical protein